MSKRFLDVVSVVIALGVVVTFVPWYLNYSTIDIGAYNRLRKIPVGAHHTYAQCGRQIHDGPCNSQHETAAEACRGIDGYHEVRLLVINPDAKLPDLVVEDYGRVECGRPR